MYLQGAMKWGWRRNCTSSPEETECNILDVLDEKLQPPVSLIFFTPCTTYHVKSYQQSTRL